MNKKIQIQLEAEENFLKELKVLLKKHKAEIKTNDSGEIRVEIGVIYDASGDNIECLSGVNLGFEIKA